MDSQNLSLLPQLVTSIESFNDFYFFEPSFLLLTQKKRSKRKGSLAGALGFGGLKVEITRGRQLPATSH
ncbi:MAG: hypothetical protein IJG80_06920, partial [Selenomonadaceae bacterium]|nr:hypothetical protein [Selenomonadaceae bacterium]